MLVLIRDDYHAMSREAAGWIARLVRRKPDAVIGFATGSTPKGLYDELIRLHREEGLDFSKVTTFNLDEYVGLPPEHPRSYHSFMWQNLFSHINVDPRFVHIPHGMADDVPGFCEWYEKQIADVGGIDLQILGIGANGHIAFNEPSSSLGSRTRIKTLSRGTREDNAHFFGSLEDVPRYAITMGVGTIMEAQQLLLVASGPAKADAIARTVEGPLSAMVPASIVQLHRDAVVVVDRDAATKLELEYLE